jgi:hypothetical protein
MVMSRRMRKAGHAARMVKRNSQKEGYYSEIGWIGLESGEGTMYVSCEHGDKPWGSITFWVTV